jgi:choline dehydrogenase
MKTQSRAGAFRWISPAATPSNVGTCRARLQPARAFCSRAVAEAVKQEFDYVIVGAGSAGCVLANRLSEDGKHSVLLLEYGDNDRADPRDLFLHMPTALAIPMNMQKYNWGFEAEPEPNLGGRRLHCPRGKVLGGSSSINGMVFVRGHALDFDHWRDQHGAHGWGYEDCLPYFKKMETWAESPHEEDAPFRATGGPLAVRNGSSQNPLYAAFVEAGKQAGYGITRDYNGHRQEGFGKMAMTVTSDGARASTATCYLRPARSRANLSVATNALAHRILFDQGAPKPKAKGVVFSKSRELRVASARREVILCAGAIGSPQLLQLSGIGPAPVLESLGVDHVARLPGVGSNLQDHLELLLQYTCKEPVSLYDNMTMLGKLAIGVRWLLMRDGLGATNHMEATGFIRSDAGIEYPDIQYHFVPLAISYDGNTSLQQHGFQVRCRRVSRARCRGRPVALPPAGARDAHNA